MNRAPVTLTFAALTWAMVIVLSFVIAHIRRTVDEIHTGVQTVTVAPSPACSDMARTWQQIAVAETRVSRLLYAGRRQSADRVAVRVPAQPRGACS